jgi:hypothetical protein
LDQAVASDAEELRTVLPEIGAAVERTWAVVRADPDRLSQGPITAAPT